MKPTSVILSLHFLHQELVSLAGKPWALLSVVQGTGCCFFIPDDPDLPYKVITQPCFIASVVQIFSPVLWHSLYLATYSSCFFSPLTSWLSFWMISSILFSNSANLRNIAHHLFSLLQVKGDSAQPRGSQLLEARYLLIGVGEQDRVEAADNLWKKTQEGQRILFQRNL